MPTIAKVRRITWSLRMPEAYGRYLTLRYADQFPDAVRVFLRTVRDTKPQNWNCDARITGTESWRTTLVLEPQDLDAMDRIMAKHNEQIWSRALMAEVREDAERSGVILEYEKRQKRGGGF